MNHSEENPITKKVNYLRRINRYKHLKEIQYTYNELINYVEEIVKREDGSSLSKILSLNKLPVSIFVIDNTSEIEFKKYIQRKKALLYEYEHFLVDYFNIIKLLCNETYILWDKLLNLSCKFLSNFIELYCKKLWLLPFLLPICFFLNEISTLADFYSSQKADIFSEDNEDSNIKNKYKIEVLNSLRGKIGKVKGEEEKHGAFVILMFQSIKLCAALNNMQTTSSFLKIINSTDIVYEYIPKKFIVLFKNQLGKLYLQKCEYEKAEKEFIWAYTNSNKNNIAFRRRILEALICIRLNKGLFPPKQLLKKYQLDVFINIIRSIKNGNIFLYNQIMNQSSKHFFEKGLHECVEQIHFIVKRNLIRIVVLWWNNTVTNDRVNNNNSTALNKLSKVPIYLFNYIFKWAKITTHQSDLETLSILSSLIISRYINAYISYDNSILVLSKADPFPSLKG